VIRTIEGGTMTGDLVRITELKDVTKVNSLEFIQAVRKELESAL
jgi:isocitrate dehydrogenase